MGRTQIAADKVAQKCADSISPVLFEPLVKQLCDDAYERLLNSVQDYLCENTEYNIAVRIEHAENRAREKHQEAEALQKDNARLRGALNHIVSLDPGNNTGAMTTGALAGLIYNMVSTAEATLYRFKSEITESEDS